MNGACEMCHEHANRLQVRNGVTVCMPCMDIVNRTFLDAPSPVAVRRAQRLAELERKVSSLSGSAS